MSDCMDLPYLEDAVMIPLLPRFLGLAIAGQPEFAIAEFELRNGTVIRFPFTREAAASFTIEHALSRLTEFHVDAAAEQPSRRPG